MEVGNADVTAQTVVIGTDVNLKFAPAQLVDGRLVAGDSGLPNAYLCFQEDGLYACATTDGDGRFALTLPPSTYHVSTQFNRDNTFFSLEFPHFAVSSASIILQTPRVQQLAGRLVDPGGQPISASVWVVCQRMSTGDLNEEFCGSSTVTDASGGFSWPSLEGSQQDLQFLLADQIEGPVISVDDVTAGGDATFVTVAIQPPLAAP